MSNGDAEYVPIDIGNLSVDLPSMCDLYVKEPARYVPFRKTPSTARRRGLVESSKTHLWIRISDETLSQGQLTPLLSLLDDDVPSITKAKLLYSSARAIARRALVETSPEELARLQGLIDATVAYLERSKTSFQTLVSAMASDSSIDSHSANVAIYSVGLGRIMGISDRQSLRNLGMGAILHDLGKSRVPHEVLNKPGPLSSEEWTIMRQHPVWGKELLAATVDIPEAIPMVVEQHHERMDGSGYPEGITGADIHLFSRIVGFVDTYEAITSDRPYGPQRTLYDGMLELREEVEAGKWDSTLFTGLVSFLEQSLL